MSMSFNGNGRSGLTPTEDFLDRYSPNQLNLGTQSFGIDSSYQHISSKNIFDEFSVKKRSFMSTSTNNSINNDEGHGESVSNKKRFVWPESLHRDFISAVYDIGLKFADAKDIQAIMNVEKGSFTQDQLKSHLQKYRIYRDRKYFPRKLFYEMECNGFSSDVVDTFDQDIFNSSSGPSSSVVEPRITDRIPYEELTKMLHGEVPISQENLDIVERSCSEYFIAMKDKLSKVQQAIKTQQSFFEIMKYSLDEQGKLCSHATHLYDTVEKALVTTDNGITEADHSSSIKERVPSSSVNVNNEIAMSASFGAQATGQRPDLHIMSEMRATMDLHRKLLLQREDQLSMHGKHQHSHHHNHSQHSHHPAHPQYPPPHMMSSIWQHAPHSQPTTHLSTSTVVPIFYPAHTSSAMAHSFAPSITQSQPVVQEPINNTNSSCDNLVHPPHLPDTREFLSSVNNPLLEPVSDVEASGGAAGHHGQTLPSRVSSTNSGSNFFPLVFSELEVTSAAENISEENDISNNNNANNSNSSNAEVSAFDPDSIDGDALFSFLMTS